MTAGDPLYASCVAVGGRGLLILGPSGSGKSGLALALIALGADLVADDQTLLRVEDGALIATCPKPLAGMIEARGVGLLAAPTAASARIALAVDLGQSEDQRLPPRRTVTIRGVAVDLVLRTGFDHFPAALMLYLAQGRRA
ncbi:MAG: serine kinase [Rhodobacterales bacterium 12-65-15]|nr:MAG: serine kinase [Rhodobacterales bacterium 12-65-15]